ncbi:glycosyltransferase [Bacillus mycoides]|uniref:glycosyltransferase n=1 Tax=Bacillus mycoides TaxID=1405 RepID=UPI003D24AA5F
MKTFIFVRNKKYRPSSYYRIYQYLENDTNNDIELIEYENDRFYNKKSRSKIMNLLNITFNSLIPGYINRIYNIIKILNKKEQYNVFIQRECFPKIVGPLGKNLLKRLISNASKVYWDFDDNIFEAKEITEFEEQLLKVYSNKIFVGNEYLQDKLNFSNKDKIIIVNTTDAMMERINLSNINHEREKTFNEQVILVWVGTKGNLKHLENIIPELEEAASKVENKRIVLRVVSDGVLNQPTKHLIIKNIKWERQVAFEEMLNAHIGLMPLIENEFTKGKCAFKAVQSIGCGLPVILSDVGMNKNVIEKRNGVLIKNDKGWPEAVIELSTNIDAWKEKSNLSRELWLEKYNAEKNKNLLLNILVQD